MLAVASVGLPMPLKRFVFRRLLGWEVAPDAWVGWSLLLADHVRLDPGSRIGHFTVVRDVAELHLGPNATVGNWNWITASRRLAASSTGPDGARPGTFQIEREAAITHRHYIDCTGGITIGALATIAGIRSTFLTHQIDRQHAHQTIAPITIGARSLVSSNVCLAPGARVPARSVVAMGAVVVDALPTEGALYAGVPAQAVRTGLTGRYFDRARGPVAVPGEHR